MNLRNATAAPASTLLGFSAGGQTLVPGVERLSHDPGDIIGWLQIAAALIQIIIGVLAK